MDYNYYLNYIKNKITSRKEIAEDIMQNSILKIMNAKSTISNFDAYFKATAANELKLNYRKEARSQNWENLETEIGYRTYIESVVDEISLSEDVEHLIKLKNSILSPKETELFNALLTYDKNLVKISEELGWNYDTTKTHYRNMLIKFKTNWRKK